MAVAGYSTDLTDIYAGAGSTTSWQALGGGQSGLNAETDYFIQGSGCTSKNAFSNSTKGMIRSSGSQVITAGDALFIWITHQTANSLDLEANGGLRIVIGSANAAYYQYFVSGNDTIIYDDRWLCAVVDPRTAVVVPDVTTGSPSATKSHFGGLAKMVGGPTKGAPFGINAIRHGRAFISVDGDLANGYANFEDASVFNDDLTRRLGQFQKSGKNYKMQGLFQMGTAATPVDFRDENRSISVARTPKVDVGFNGFEVVNAASRVDWNNISISPLGTGSTGYFECIDDADVNLTNCKFEEMQTFKFLSNSTVDGNIFLDCQAVTQGGGSITGCRLVGCDPMVIDNLALVTGNSFVSGGTGYAVDFGTISADFAVSWANENTGYAAADGATGNETILVNVAAGQTLTINVADGFTAPTVHNVGAGFFDVVVGQATLTIANAVNGSTVNIFDDEDPDPQFLGTLLATQEPLSGTVYQFNHSKAGDDVVVQMIADGFEEINRTISLTALDQTILLDPEPEVNL